MPDRYAGTADLLVGGMIVNPTEAAQFIEVAADEIDSVLGFTYVIPLTAVEPHVALILKRVNALIASGRLILSTAVGGEDGSLHAYGRSLLMEGQDTLAAIANGNIQLVGADKTAPHADDGTGNAPSISQGDATSGVDAFYAWLDRDPYSAPTTPGDPWWSPGA